MKLYYSSIIIYIVLNIIKLNNAQCPYSQNVIKGASATFYTSIDNGNCGYEKLNGLLGPGNNMIAALGSKLYKDGAQCGQCFKITNSLNASVTVVATDSCHDSGYCQRDNHFDLSIDAFQILGKTSQGVLDNLSYIKVPCQVNGNVKVMMKDGSNPYWTAFFIFNNKVTIKNVSIRMSNANQFKQLTKTSYNYYPTSISGTNFEIRIESIGGEFIYITIPQVESRKIYDTNTQFTSSGCSIDASKPNIETKSPSIETKSPSIGTKSSTYNSCPNYIHNNDQNIYSNDDLNSNSIILSISIFNFIIIIMFLIL